jgi:hypothetical protein
MKKVYQTEFGDKGNCLSACISTITGIKINKLPKIDLYDGWLRRYNSGLKYHGYVLLYDKSCNISAYLDGGCYICAGKTKRGTHHAVVFKNGKMIHDPHPDGTGLQGISEMYYLAYYIDEDVK